MTHNAQRILLIEDSPSDAFLFGELVKGMGGCFELHVAGSLGEGLAAAGRQEPHVVFLDMGLPDSHGMETVRRAVASFRDVPVVVLTGTDDEQMGVDSLRAGAQDYLTKGSISLDSVARCARYAIERHRILVDLHEARAHLEEKVQERTAELARTVHALEDEARRRMAAEAERHEAEMEVLRATEREQCRLGRDLHDSIQGTLTGIDLMLRTHQGGITRAGGPNAAALAAQAGDIGDLVRQTIRQTRGLSRGLCPLELTGSGLRRALELMAETIASLFGVKCEFTAAGDVDMPDEIVASQIYYIVQEATTNALKHARCKLIDVTLRREADQIVATVEDNGIGMPAQPRNPDGMGLKTMHHRAKLIGAALEIEARRPQGATIRLVIPAASLIRALGAVRV